MVSEVLTKYICVFSMIVLKTYNDDKLIGIVQSTLV